MAVLYGKAINLTFALASVPDPWHFGVDPDPDPAILSLTFKTPKKTNLKKSFSAYLFLQARLHHFSKIKKSKSGHKTVGIKVLITIFAWWQKDPDPYLWLMDPEHWPWLSVFVVFYEGHSAGSEQPYLVVGWGEAMDWLDAGSWSDAGQVVNAAQRRTGSRRWRARPEPGKRAA